jgi:hypothetical protein
LNLPISYNPLDFGVLLYENKFEEYIQFTLQTENGFIFKINKFENHNEIELFKSGKCLFKFRDQLVSENKFMRIIGNKKYFFENNQQILFTKEIKTKFISKLANIKNLTNNLITLDIETFVNNNELIPYLICYYDGKNCYSFGL